MRLFEKGIIAQVIKLTGLPKNKVYSILRAECNPHYTYTKKDFLSISNALQKLGLDVSANDLAVGWGVSNNPIHRAYRSKLGVLKSQQTLAELKNRLDNLLSYSTS